MGLTIRNMWGRCQMVSRRRTECAGGVAVGGGAVVGVTKTFVRNCYDKAYNTRNVLSKVLKKYESLLPHVSGDRVWAKLLHS